MKYNIQYFLNKAKSIPDHLWHIGNFWESHDPSGPRCWLGHCSVALADYVPRGASAEQQDECRAICLLADRHRINFAAINDGNNEDVIGIDRGLRFIEGPNLTTPKERIIAALMWMAEQEGVVLLPDYKDITKELATLPINETSDSFIIKTPVYEI